jgi:uncharacterized protein YcgI (DUF1989 family)
MKPRASLAINQQIPVPARTGVAVELKAGVYVQVTDVQGMQPADFWAFSRKDLQEFLSPSHTRTYLSRLFPTIGQSFCTNRRRPILQLVDDTVGVHDMVWAACDPLRYRMFGVEEPHPSCGENLLIGTKRLGLEVASVPDPVNLFTKIQIQPDGTIQMLPAPSKAGDFIVMKAWIDCVVAVSACPSDLTPVAGYFPTDLRVSVMVEDGEPDESRPA